MKSLAALATLGALALSAASITAAHAEDPSPQSLVFASYEVQRLSFYTSIFRSKSSKALLYVDGYSDGTPEDVKKGKATDTGWGSAGLPVQMYFEDLDLTIRAHISSQHGSVQRTVSSPVVESNLLVYGGGLTLGDLIYVDVSYVDARNAAQSKTSTTKIGGGLVPQIGVPKLSLYHVMSISTGGVVGNTSDFLRLATDQVLDLTWVWARERLGPLRPLYDFRLAIDTVREDAVSNKRGPRRYYADVADRGLVTLVLKEQPGGLSYFIAFPAAAHVGLNVEDGNYASAGVAPGLRLRWKNTLFEAFFPRVEGARMFKLGNETNLDGFRGLVDLTATWERETGNNLAGNSGYYCHLEGGVQRNFPETLWRVGYLKGRTVESARLDLGWAW